MTKLIIYAMNIMKYIRYCNNCKQNIRMKYEKEHKKHERIYFGIY